MGYSIICSAGATGAELRGPHLMQAYALGGRSGGERGCLAGGAHARSGRRLKAAAAAAAEAAAAAAAGAGGGRRPRASPVAVRWHVRRLCATIKVLKTVKDSKLCWLSKRVREIASAYWQSGVVPSSSHKRPGIGPGGLQRMVHEQLSQASNEEGLP